MSERIRGSYDDALYKSTYTLLTLYAKTVYRQRDTHLSTKVTGLDVE